MVNLALCNTVGICFLPCDHLTFESEVTAQNTEFNIKTWPRNSTLSLATYRYVSWVHLLQHNNCVQGKQSLDSRWNFISMLTEFTWPWQWTLTNWNDVNYTFPWCHTVHLRKHETVWSGSCQCDWKFFFQTFTLVVNRWPTSLRKQWFS